MKLTQIKIIHFGKLNDVTFNLNKDLTIFLGANEAGKSTTVAFVKQVLFGFHLRTNKSPFFETYQPLDHVSPMGGSLTFEDTWNTLCTSDRLSGNSSWYAISTTLLKIKNGPI